MRSLTVLLLAAALLSSMPTTALAYSEAQFQSVTSEQEAKVNQIRDQEINQIKIVMGRRFSESRQPDILLRLAELYTEKYRFYFLKENEVHQKQLQQGLKPRSVNHDRSKEYLRSSTNACLAILKSRVSYAKLDQVYYFLGYNAEELGKRKDAEKYFAELVRRNPRSQFAPEAYRNLAEYAFDRKQFAKSVSLYEKAAAYTNVPSYPRTLYKLAWSYFKTRRKAEALATLKKVVSISGTDETFVGLREEALNDLVMFFSEAGKAREAHDYFHEIAGGPELYVKSLGKLSAMYDRRGDYRLAMNVNNTLMEEYGKDRPDLVHEALGRNVELYRKLGDHKGEEAALTRLVNFFAENSDKIARSGDSEAAFGRTKAYLRSRATEVHKEAQKKKDAKLYARAADLYGLYIRAFLADPQDAKQRLELSQMRVYRADSLLAAGREEEALPELESTLRADGDAKLRKEAGTTLLTLLLKKLNAQKAAKSESPSDLERRFLSAADAFEKAFPSDKLVSELRYKRAMLAAGRSGPDGFNDEAREALAELVAKYPGRPESAAAAQDLVADAVKRKKPAEAVRLAEGFLANRQLLAADKQGGLQKYLRSVVSHQQFSAVQDLEKDDEFEKAAAQYEKLAVASKGDAEVAFKSYNNAAVNYERAGNTDAAIRVLSQMVSQFPEKAEPREGLKRLAASKLWSSRYAEAGRTYTRLASLPMFSSDERLSFVRTGFWLHWGTGDLASAALVATTGLREACTGQPVKKAKGKTSGRSGSYADDRCHELAIDLGRLFIEAGKLQEALNHLRQYLAADHAGTRKAEAAYLLGTVYQKLSEPRRAMTYFEEASRAVKPGGRADVRERNNAAHAAFLLVEPHFTRFSSIKLELPEDKLKKATRQKLDQLEDLVTRYLNVVRYGDGEWGIAALERLYDMFAGFSSELDAAPVPHGANPDQYRRGIRQVSEPMMARALEYLKQGHQKGLQLGVTTPTYIALTQRLSRTLPKQFPPAHYSLSAEASRVRSATLKLVGPVQEGESAGLAKADHPWRQAVGAKLKENPKSPEAWIELGNLEVLAGRLKLANLLYEQAISLSPKNAAALSNLSVVLFLEQKPIEATQGFLRALDLAEANKDIKLNLVKCLLAYHHFSHAREHARALAGRFPDDGEVGEAHAVAALGTGDLKAAAKLLDDLDAEDSKRFSLWYNWTVRVLASGDSNEREAAIELIKKRAREITPLEKSQVDLVLSLLGDEPEPNEEEEVQ